MAGTRGEKLLLLLRKQIEKLCYFLLVVGLELSEAKFLQSVFLQSNVYGFLRVNGHRARS